MAFRQRSTYPLYLSILSGILLCLGWPPSGAGWILFAGFVPLLFLEEHFFQLPGAGPRFNVFLYSFLSFLIWNVGTTWWIFNSTAWGSIAAFVFNALFMAFIFWLFHMVRLKYGRFAYLALPAFWIAFEYLHLNWDLSWPWLTLGNGMADNHHLIQFYEYTGVLGGSAWILLVNILFYFYFKSFENWKFGSFFRKSLVPIAAVIFVPILISLFIFENYKEKKNPVSVVIVQPNIDPYNEKFSGNGEEQLDKFLKLAATAVDSNTEYLIGPETAIPEGIWEHEIPLDPNIFTLNQFLVQFPKLKLICGISSAKEFRMGEKITATARPFADGKGYFEEYNTAMQLDSSSNVQLYHKSRLVPGVEKMPYPKIFGFLEKLSIDLGGTSGSLGVQDERSVFVSPVAKVAPVICYESVYGEFLSGYVRNGANLIAVITNDGWWGDTPGYRQHLLFGRLRSIELRKSIVRSGNTGISCIIDQRGDIHNETSYWKSAVIKSQVNISDVSTFYSRNGDFIGRVAGLISLLFISLLVVQRIFFGRNR